MLQWKKAAILLLYLHFCFLKVNTFCQNLNFRTFSFDQGLSTYNIKKTLQDRYGFIWIATQDGLFRYDGSGFESFKKNTGTQPGLRENFLFDIALDNDEFLYAALFNGGVDRVNIRTLEITPLLSVRNKDLDGLPNLWITKLYCDRNNSLWIGGKDFLSIYDQKTKKYLHIKPPPPLQHSGINVTFIRPLDENRVAVGADNYGVLVYNIHSFQFEGEINWRTQYGLSGVSVTDLLCIGDSVYISAGSLLFAGVFKDFWQPGRKIIIPALKEKVVNCLLHEKNDILWLGYNTGLGRFELSSGTFIPTPVEKMAGTENFTYHLLLDNQRGLWVSSMNNLARINLLPTPFRAYKESRDGKTRMNHIYALVPKSATEIFACGTDGLYLCNLETSDVKKIAGTGSLGIIHYVFKFTDDFWILTADFGMYAYVPRSGIISKSLLLERFPEWKPFAHHYFNNSLTVNGKIYWASEEQEGLLVWQPQEHTLKQYKYGGGRHGGLPENHIHSIKLDRDGNIWLLFDNAVARFNPEADTVTQVLWYQKNNKGFNAGIFFDVHDDGEQLWFATYGGGINGYHKKNGTWTYITENEGLCNNSVYGILPESDSVFWVCTNNGLSRVNFRTRKCRNYFEADGLHNNSFDEQGAISWQEKLLFSGVGGFTSVRLSQYEFFNYPFPVYVKRVDFIRNNQKTELYNLHWNTLKLPAGTSTATIWLSAINFGQAKAGFSYKIRGFHDDFVPAGDNNKIELNALNHGTYNISIRYINERSELPEKIINLQLKVTPYWYQTGWFKTLVALAAAGLLLFISGMIYLARLRRQRAEMEKQLAVQLERNRISSEMHDDIGAGLSGVKLLTELTMNKIQDVTVAGDLKKIYQSVGEISSRMKEVIWSLNTENNNLGSMLSYIQKQSRAMLENYACKFTISLPDEIPDVNISGDRRRNIYLIIKEALHNIIKHSGADQVEISIACKDQLIISISDNGKGMSPDDNCSGGHGLKNIQKRINGLHGKCHIINKKGLTLIFEIPLNQER